MHFSSSSKQDNTSPFMRTLTPFKRGKYIWYLQKKIHKYNSNQVHIQPEKLWRPDIMVILFMIMVIVGRLDIMVKELFETNSKKKCEQYKLGLQYLACCPKQY